MLVAFFVVTTAIKLTVYDNSGADNSNNSSNPDTSMIFCKKYPYVILFQNQS